MGADGHRLSGPHQLELNLPASAVPVLREEVKHFENALVLAEDVLHDVLHEDTCIGEVKMRDLRPQSGATWPARALLDATHPRWRSG